MDEQENGLIYNALGLRLTLMIPMLKILSTKLGYEDIVDAEVIRKSTSIINLTPSIKIFQSNSPKSKVDWMRIAKINTKSSDLIKLPISHISPLRLMVEDNQVCAYLPEQWVAEIARIHQGFNGIDGKLILPNIPLLKARDHESAVKGWNLFYKLSPKMIVSPRSLVCLNDKEEVLI